MELDSRLKNFKQVCPPVLMSIKIFESDAEGRAIHLGALTGSNVCLCPGDTRNTLEEPQYFLDVQNCCLAARLLKPN